MKCVLICKFDISFHVGVAGQQLCATEHTHHITSPLQPLCLHHLHIWIMEMIEGWK